LLRLGFLGRPNVDASQEEKNHYYTKTDAGTLVGYTKVFRLIILKELGKFTL